MSSNFAQGNEMMTKLIRLYMKQVQIVQVRIVNVKQKWRIATLTGK